MCRSRCSRVGCTICCQNVEPCFRLKKRIGKRPAIPEHRKTVGWCPEMYCLYDSSASRLSPGLCKQERKRGQRERQAAARVEQRKKTAAAAASVVTAGDEQHGRENTKKGGPRRQSSAQNGSTTVTDAFSQRIKTPGTSTARPRSSSQSANNEDRLATQVVSTLGDSSKGVSGGGGGTRLSTPSSGRLASPVVRGFSRRSNRKLVRNAINFLCLAGGHLEEKKSRALEVWQFLPLMSDCCWSTVSSDLRDA